MLVFILSGFLYFNVITEIYKDTENNKALFERRNSLNSKCSCILLILSVLYLVNYSFIVKFYSGYYAVQQCLPHMILVYYQKIM